MRRVLKGLLKWTFRLFLLRLFVAFLLIFIAYWRSTNNCEELTAVQGETMKAIVYCEYGLPNLKL